MLDLPAKNPRGGNEGVKNFILVVLCLFLSLFIEIAKCIVTQTSFELCLQQMYYFNWNIIKFRLVYLALWLISGFVFKWDVYCHHFLMKILLLDGFKNKKLVLANPLIYHRLRHFFNTKMFYIYVIKNGVGQCWITGSILLEGLIELFHIPTSAAQLV